MDVLKKFYAGDIILWKSYWLGAVLFSLVVGVAAGLIILSTGIVILGKIFYGAWTIVSAIGVWRSSDKYTGPRYWSILAKIGIIVGLVQVLNSFTQY